MKRFVNPAPQFFDNDGNILSGGKVNFYENGSTTTRKNTFNANNGSINTNPVRLSAEGRLPPCWGEGQYTVVVTDADGVQIWQRNDVEFGGDDGQFSDYSPVRNYAQGETARYTDGKYYISLSNNNLGNAPDVSTTKWSQIAFLEYWNPDYPGGYSEDDIVIDGGYLYRSKVNSNTDITSVTASWENLSFNDFIDGNLTVTGGVFSSYEGAAIRDETLSITTDTTLNKDPLLTISGLASGWYQVRGYIVFNTNAGGAGNGLKITMDGDANTALQNITWQRFTGTGAVDALTTTTPVFEDASSSDRYIVFNGSIRLDSGGELAVWVSQNVSSATAVQIKSGSSLTVKRTGVGV